MKQPEMDFEIWKQLRQKWTDLDAAGHTLKVDFQLVEHPAQKNYVLAIDVVQHIDGEPVTETVQRHAGEAYGVLGIADLSMEQLVEVYKGLIRGLGGQPRQEEVDVAVTMTPTSATSGEVRGRLGTNEPIPVNYQHYYVLNALRDKMIETLGERWSQVRAVYHAGDLEFHFDYA